MSHVTLDVPSGACAHLGVLAAPRRLMEVAPLLTDQVVADTQGKQRPHVGGSYGTVAGNMVLGA